MAKLLLVAQSPLQPVGQPLTEMRQQTAPRMTEPSSNAKTTATIDLPLTSTATSTGTCMLKWTSKYGKRGEMQAHGYTKAPALEWDRQEPRTCVQRA